MQVLYLADLDSDAIQTLRAAAPAAMLVDALSPSCFAPTTERVEPQPPPVATRSGSSDERVAGEVISKAEVVIGGLVPPGFLEAAVSLRYWIVPFAGIPAATREALRSRRDLVVLNSHYNAPFVAEHAWALLLAAAKRIVPASGQLRGGDWRHRFGKPSARYLGGTTLLLLGYGAIGRALVPHARACRMRVLAIRRTPGPASEAGAIGTLESPHHGPDEADSIGTRENLAAWLAEADAVVVSLPGTPATSGYLGPAEFACLKPGALLVNVGRGTTIDEDAFHEALGSGRLGGAGIDTWWEYPKGVEARSRTAPSRHDLSQFDNLVFSPHCASHVAGQERRRFEALGEILRSIASGSPIGRVDLEAGY